MADIRRVTDTFAVAAQLQPEDIPALRGRFGLVINNRPDGEAPDQPLGAEIERAVRAAGLDYLALPFAGPPGAAQVAATSEALARSVPTLAFCLSGTRSILAWALAEAAAGVPLDQLEGLAEQAGYRIGPPIRALASRPGC